MNKFVLIAFALAAISGVGVLSSNIFSVSLQPYQVFNSFSDFSNPVCTCAGEDGLFTMENCEGFDGSPYSDPNMLCVSEAGVEEYGRQVPLLIQGCGVDFWKNSIQISELDTIESGNPSIWPSGYQPEYYFNDMFHTTISQPQNVLGVNEEKESDEDRKNKDSDDVSSPNDIISGESKNELKDNNKVSEDKDDKDKDVDDVSRNDVFAGETKDEAETIREQTAEDEDSKNKDSDDVTSPNDVISAESENELKDNNKNNFKDKEDVIGKAEEKDGREKLKNDKPNNGPTLLQALEANGREMNGLLRNSVAALLNAAHSEINYPYSVSQVITMTQVALINQDWQKTSDLFEEYNENAEKPPLCLG